MRQQIRNTILYTLALTVVLVHRVRPRSAGSGPGSVFQNAADWILSEHLQ